MNILPKLVGVILLLASIIVGGKLIYDATFFDFWTTQWLIGNALIIILIGSGIGLLFLSSEKAGFLAISIVGCSYMIASFVFYFSWGYNHITKTLSFSDYFGFLFLFITVLTIAATGVTVAVEKNGLSRKIFLIPAWSFAAANLLCLFLVINKYIFQAVQWDLWACLGEIIIITAGAAVFIGTYIAAKDSRISL
jgi:hypothetical protein